MRDRGARLRRLACIGRLRSAAQCALIAVLLAAVAPAALWAQHSQRGQPKTPFSLVDFGKLRWLEGSWAATSNGEEPMFQRFHFTDDSTVSITYYRDAGFTQQTAVGKLYLSVGRVYHTFGPNRWGATHVDADGAFFVPQTNAHNTFAWDYKSPDEWTATMRTGLSGHERTTVWTMKRIK